MSNKLNKHFKKFFLPLILIVLSLIGFVSAKENTKQSTPMTIAIISKKIEGKYLDVVQNIRSAILGKGIHIAHELHAGDMLQRTGTAYGYKKSIYSNAEIIEFCSAELSQKLARIDPDNIVLCPFSIGIYSLLSEKNIVHISYQVPNGKPGTEEVVEEIKALISEIIEDASW